MSAGSGGLAPDEESCVTIYVKVEDLQAAIEESERLGATTVQPPTEEPARRSPSSTDPAGHRIAS